MLPMTVLMGAYAWWKFKTASETAMESKVKKTFLTILAVLGDKIESLEGLLAISEEREKSANRVMDEQARELKALRENPAYAALIDVARAAEDVIRFAQPIRGKEQDRYRVSLGALKDQVDRWHLCVKTGKPQ